MTVGGSCSGGSTAKTSRKEIDEATLGPWLLVEWAVDICESSHRYYFLVGSSPRRWPELRGDRWAVLIWPPAPTAQSLKRSYRLQRWRMKQSSLQDHRCDRLDSSCMASHCSCMARQGVCRFWIRTAGRRAIATGKKCR